jgi:hypothetical protein
MAQLPRRADDDFTPGYLFEAIIRQCRLPCVPDVYLKARGEMEQHRLISTYYAAPDAGKARDLAELHRCGQYTKVPPEQRLVDGEGCLWLHFERAKLLKFPRRDGASGIQPYLRECAKRIVQHADGLPSQTTVVRG